MISFYYHNASVNIEDNFLTETIVIWLKDVLITSSDGSFI